MRASTILHVTVIALASEIITTWLTSYRSAFDIEGVWFQSRGDYWQERLGFWLLSFAGLMLLSIIIALVKSRLQTRNRGVGAA